MGDAPVLAILGAGVMGARRDGFVRRRIEAASLRHDELDRVEEALVLRDVRIHHRGDLRHDVAAGVAEGRVGLQLGPLVGAGEVDGQLLAGDGHLRPDHEGALADAERFIARVRPLQHADVAVAAEVVAAFVRARGERPAHRLRLRCSAHRQGQAQTLQFARQCGKERLAWLDAAARQMPAGDIAVLDQKHPAGVVDHQRADAERHAARESPISMQRAP